MIQCPNTECSQYDVPKSTADRTPMPGLSDIPIVCGACGAVCVPV